MPQPPQLPPPVVSTQLPPQQVSPSAQSAPMPGAPQAWHRPAMQTSPALGQSAAVVQPHWPETHVMPGPHGEQSAVFGSQLALSVPQVHAPSRQPMPAAHAAPHAPQFASSKLSSTQLLPQHVSPLPHAKPSLSAAPHDLQVPDTQTCVAPHCDESVQPQGPLEHVEPQHTPPVLQAAPPLPASPQSVHAPPTQVCDASGQSATVVQPQWSVVHDLPAPHGVQLAVPPAHALLAVPHSQPPASHAVPAAQVVLHAPQLASSEVVSVQPPPQHVVPLAHALPEPRPSHGTHLDPRHTLSGPPH